ncbi:MAG: hypothetical protein LBQ92_01750, partial [Propionibacteriaceae bacterium]|nr:hypothetical protein [Propionibacteriaceae bacterium]
MKNKGTKRFLSLLLAFTISFGVSLTAYADPTPEPQSEPSASQTAADPDGTAETDADKAAETAPAADPVAEPPQTEPTTTEPTATETSASTPAETQPTTTEPTATPPLARESSTPSATAQTRSGFRLGADSIDDINPGFLLTLTGTGATTVPAGDILKVNLEADATGLPSTSGTGVLIVIPAHEDLCLTSTQLQNRQCHTFVDAGNGAVELRTNYVNPATGAVIPQALLIWKQSSFGALLVPTLEVQYRFDNGSTPDATTFAVQAYMYQAEGISGNGQTDTGIVAASGHGESATVTLTNTASESWAVTKTVAQPESGWVFPSLVERPYSEVNIPNAEDYHTIVYKLIVSSDKGVSDSGRVFQSRIHVEDTLSGFLAGKAPYSITVKDCTGFSMSDCLDGSSGTAVDALSITDATTTAKNISFDLPNV